MSSLNAHLKDLVGELSADLPEVSERRMFGSDAFFANRIIYALVWDGRVCLKFPDPAAYEKASALEGSEPFDPSGRGHSMGKWVVLPEGVADDVEALRPLVEVAHRLALSQPPKPVKKPKQLRAARAPEPRTGTARASRASGAESQRGSRSPSPRAKAPRRGGSGRSTSRRRGTTRR